MDKITICKCCKNPEVQCECYIETEELKSQIEVLQKKVSENEVAIDEIKRTLRNHFNLIRRSLPQQLAT